MTNTINFKQAKVALQQKQLADSFYSMYYSWIDLFLHFWIYPAVAAVETVKQRKIVVLR